MGGVVSGDHHVVAGAPGQRHHRVAQAEPDATRVGQRERPARGLLHPGQHHLTVDDHRHPGAVAGQLQLVIDPGNRDVTAAESTGMRAGWPVASSRITRTTLVPSTTTHTASSSPHDGRVRVRPSVARAPGRRWARSTAPHRPPGPPGSRRRYRFRCGRRPPPADRSWRRTGPGTLVAPWPSRRPWRRPSTRAHRRSRRRPRRDRWRRRRWSSNRRRNGRPAGHRRR